MILWLIQPGDALPASPEAALSVAEATAWATLTVPKRRRDWLLGRVTAKRLLEQYLTSRDGSAPAPQRITVAADADGAPYASLDGERLPLSLSISHSHDMALCALCDEPGVNVGADIELIEPRDPAFLTDFFKVEEQVWVASQPDVELATTLLWSAKEAVLKALREGLRIDTKQIAIAAPAREPGDLPEQWVELDVTLADELTQRFPGSLTLWWRPFGEFVLTMAQWQKAVQINSEK